MTRTWSLGSWIREQAVVYGRWGGHCHPLTPFCPPAGTDFACATYWMIPEHRYSTIDLVHDPAGRFRNQVIGLDLYRWAKTYVLDGPQEGEYILFNPKPLIEFIEFCETNESRFHCSVIGDAMDINPVKNWLEKVHFGAID